ncbi:MAG: ABC transporter permease [Bacteroides sp.]|nr:ABC transporter permease [Roseburia sp.]MCM1346388.1 ABC transporter permease [Bacteroides sp.]MCM1421783.1 ABC transporter permease [Bacteroides sp.]
MIRYVRQVFAMIRDNKLFSCIYIVGTAVAIAFTMVIAIAWYVKIAPIYPEVNRMRTMYLDACEYTDSTALCVFWSGFSKKALDEWGYHLENAEVTCGVIRPVGYVRAEGDIHEYPVNMTYTDVGFFKIYPLRFKEGRPFTQKEFDGAVRVAVISDEQARKLYGCDEDIVGRTIFLDSDTMRIVGVVESASALTPRSYAQVYAPFTLCPSWEQSGRPWQGSLSMVMMMPDAGRKQALRNEIADIARRYNLQGGKWRLNLDGQPVGHVDNALSETNWGKKERETETVMDVVRKLVLMLMVLLVVPALNLSGMIARRMEVRRAEMGVRKAFGATRAALLWQVVNENFVLTLLGGMLGLLLSWCVFYVFRTWVFGLVDSGFYYNLMETGAQAALSGEMLFSPLIFLGALLFCMALNLLSALVPAWLSLRMPIVNSMNVKR